MLIFIFSSLVFRKISWDLKPIIFTLNLLFTHYMGQLLVSQSVSSSVRSEHSTVSENVEQRPGLKVPTVKRFLTYGRHLKDFYYVSKQSCRSVTVLLNMKRKENCLGRTWGSYYSKLRKDLKLLEGASIKKIQTSVLALSRAGEPWEGVDQILGVVDLEGVDLGNILSSGFKHNSGTRREPNISMFDMMIDHLALML